MTEAIKEVRRAELTPRGAPAGAPSPKRGDGARRSVSVAPERDLLN